MDMASDVYIMFSMRCSNMINATNAHGLRRGSKGAILSSAVERREGKEGNRGRRDGLEEKEGEEEEREGAKGANGEKGKTGGKGAEGGEKAWR